MNFNLNGLINGWAFSNPKQKWSKDDVNDLNDLYMQLADSLIESQMYIEQSSGLSINYSLNRLGMNKDLLAVMQSKNIRILTASDAHKPDDVGKIIN